MMDGFGRITLGIRRKMDYQKGHVRESTHNGLA